MVDSLPPPACRVGGGDVSRPWLHLVARPHGNHVPGNGFGEVGAGRGAPVDHGLVVEAHYLVGRVGVEERGQGRGGITKVVAEVV